MGLAAKLNKRRWSAIRIVIFERDGWRCVQCRKSGRLECDHVVPLSRNGEPYETDNLQTLCRGCHIRKTRKERTGYKSNPAAKAWEHSWKSLL